MRLHVAHEFLPRTGTVRASRVMDHFGISFEQGRHVVADGLELPIDPGKIEPRQIVLFTGPSGSGKSSLMREAARQLANSAPGLALPDDPQAHHTPPVVLDIEALPTGDQLLIDSLPLEAIDAMQLLAQCGLGEARLLLRRPSELSDGQRYRFRLALALSQGAAWIMADEFTATLDRTLARVIAFNLRRLADRTGVGFLLATTHEDVAKDLSPDVHVCCALDGTIDVRSPACLNQTPTSPVAEASEPANKPGSARKKKRVSFEPDLWISAATRRDWPYFARWHYRSHQLPLTRFHMLLWHGDEPIGICVFSTPPLSLAGRNRFFGRSGRWDRLRIQSLNRQVSMLSRVVLHPTYRGAGIGAAFVRRSCELCPFPWIETLSEMGRVNPFFESAGFVRVFGGAGRATKVRSRCKHSSIYGGRRKDGRRILVSRETYEKSRWSKPVYYIFDNREACTAFNSHQADQNAID